MVHKGGADDDRNNGNGDKKDGDNNSKDNGGNLGNNGDDDGRNDKVESEQDVRYSSRISRLPSAANMAAVFCFPLIIDHSRPTSADSTWVIET